MPRIIIQNEWRSVAIEGHKVEVRASKHEQGDLLICESITANRAELAAEAVKKGLGALRLQRELVFSWRRNVRKVSFVVNLFVCLDLRGVRLTLNERRP